jgi:mRNA interferase MazF
MALTYHPKQGSIVLADFDRGFVPPEMVKKRLAVVLTPQIKERSRLCTVVPLSTSRPETIMPYHTEITIPFDIPEPWGNVSRRVKGYMVYALSIERLNLLRLARDGSGKRRHQTQVLPTDDLRRIQVCVLNGLGMNGLTRFL